MLITKQVEMRWNSKNKARYESFGYKYTKMKDTFLVNVEHLPHASLVDVLVSCDYCGKHFTTSFFRYFEGTKSCVKKDACPDCRGRKGQEVLHIKYGEHALGNSLFDKKRKQTNMVKYGSENVFGSEQIKNKIIETNIQKYGCVNPMQNPKIEQKMHDTCNKKYGVDSYVDKLKGLYIKENSPCWKGGNPSGRSERMTYEYRTWRSNVFQRDKYLCQCCSQKGNRINAHHIFNWKDNPSLRYDISNGITLCENCHKKFHTLYGKQNTTLEQLSEFLKGKKEVS